MARTAGEHIASAELLLKPKREYFNGGQTVRDYDPSDNAIARAQVHAIIALALITEVNS